MYIGMNELRSRDGNRNLNFDGTKVVGLGTISEQGVGGTIS